MEGNITIPVLEKFLKQFSAIKCSYKNTKDVISLKNSIIMILEEYKEYYGIGDLLLMYGEELISSGEQVSGISVLKIIRDFRVDVANQTLLYVRLAENAFFNGNTYECRDFLLLWLDKVDNYEESIEINGLQSVWERCRHLVENEIRKVEFSAPTDSHECSVTLNDIIELPQDEFIYAMSERLDELSADGKRLDLLSGQEFFVFLINEFIEDINSDGLEHYFSYNSAHFIDLYRAFCDVGCADAKELWNKINKSILSYFDLDENSGVEKVLSKIADSEINLDEEESFYYEKVEKNLLRDVYRYVLKKQSCFK